MRWPITLTLTLALLASGCAAPMRTPFTDAEEERAEVVGAPGVRVFANQASASFGEKKRKIAQTSMQQSSEQTYLALSGGGADGAYGAGVLCGWTTSGKRPTFSIVSGVSTGALMGPFAFLGSAYDDTLKRLYTEGFAQDLVAGASPLRALTGESLVGNNKLIDLVSRFTDEPLLAAIAKEHARGRRFYVLTTNIDAQRGVIWDMGAIASRGPSALSLFRQVITASASVPGLFAPQLIDVTVDGRVFQEMHVDGLTVSQILTAPDRLLLDLSGDKQRRTRKRLFVLINAKIEPTFEVVKQSTLAIAARSLSTSINQKTLNNAISAYQSAKTSGIEYNLTYIDHTVSEVGSDSFETNFMRGLFDYGFRIGSGGNFWLHKPPAIETAAPSAGVPTAPAKPVTPATPSNSTPAAAAGPVGAAGADSGVAPQTPTAAAPLTSAAPRTNTLETAAGR